MRRSKEARDAYVEAEITTALAHQIRAMRMDRNLSQAELAKQMKTTQAAISRLEDPSYGQLSLQTLFRLSRAFDTGLRVEFVSTLAMLAATHKPNEAARHIPSFEDEAGDVVFYTPIHRRDTENTLTVQAKTLQSNSTRILTSNVIAESQFQQRQYLHTVNTAALRDELNELATIPDQTEKACYTFSATNP